MTARAAAGRYARALFDVVVREGDPRKVDAELSSFSDLVTGNEELRRVLINPAIPVSRKRAAVEALLKLAGPLTPALAKLLLLVADRDRLALVPDIAAAYRERLQQHLKVVRAEVTTAVPLPEERRAALERRLTAATGQAVRLTTQVNAALIGGAVTRIGSTVYDGSVARQLERLREQLAGE